MIPRKPLRLVFLLASSACLALGFALGNLWVGAGLAALTGALVVAVIRSEARWIPTTFLFALVCLAAAGVLARGPVFPMILAVALALGAWDLMAFDHCLDTSAQPKARAPVDTRHILFLGGALGLGLALAAGGLVLSFRIPFPLMLLVAILGFAGLDGAVHPRE